MTETQLPELITQYLPSRYRHPSLAAVFGLFVAVAAGPVQAADLSGYLSLTSDYVWRGVTQSDGDVAIQLGGDVAFDSGVYAGAWGSTIDISNGPTRQRDNELTLYLGYGLELNDAWVLSATAVSYNYPGQTGSVDYDYEELQLSANYDDRFWVQYAYSPDLYDSGDRAHNAEIYTEWPLGDQAAIGAGIGYYDLSSFNGNGYAYWELGITWPVSRIDLDLRYHDTNRWVPVVSSADRAGSRVALSLRFSF